jgi:acetyltransferase-like isoleucine patch superfamily enzyme
VADPILVDHEGLGGRFASGQGCVFGPGCEIDTSGNVLLGDFVAFGQGVLVINHHHPDYCVDGASHDAVADSLTISDHVFIGDRAIILPQVGRIGRHAIVGAGAVVTKDVPDYHVVAGNPARHIRTRNLNGA